jgi:hypothetical protein
MAPMIASRMASAQIAAGHTFGSTGGLIIAERVGRRDFLSALGVTVGAAALAGASMAGPGKLEAVEPSKGNIPDKPLKMGHMTFSPVPLPCWGSHPRKGISWPPRRSTHGEGS